MALSQTVDLSCDRCAVDSFLTGLLHSVESSANGIVQEAMRYAVLGSAQRIRPIISLRIARMFEAPEAPTMRAAAAVELLHCASLIIDDLPCMDNSAYRRGRAAVHARFGEATAVLAGFGLVALAARMLVEAVSREDHRRRLLEFQILLLRTLDCQGLIAGQMLDLMPRIPGLGACHEISELKTVPLFRLAVMAGALFADPDENQAALLNCFGREFGLLFQMSDDLLDGEAVSCCAFEEKLSTLRAAIAPFGAASRSLEELVDYLNGRVLAQRSN